MILLSTNQPLHFYVNLLLEKKMTKSKYSFVFQKKELVPNQQIHCTLVISDLALII
eukprot:UN22106